MILDFADDVVFTQETADGFRSLGREALARIVERVVADGARNAIDRHRVYALSERNDVTQTLHLTAPIRTSRQGLGQVSSRSNRYVSELALMKAPKTTRELRELDGG